MLNETETYKGLRCITGILEVVLFFFLFGVCSAPLASIFKVREDCVDCR